MTTLFGIKNCDTIKKARKWLQEHGVEYKFHDYRVDGLDPQWLQEVIQTQGWEKVLNKRGTTYRQLPEEQKVNLSESTATAILQQYPAMIKRPILQKEQTLLVGFDPESYQETLL